MRAMLLHELGGPVTFQEVKKPSPGPTEALLRVRAAGVGLTIIIMKNTPGLVTRYPRILGHEIAGEVVEVGSEVTNVKGRRSCRMSLLSYLQGLQILPERPGNPL